MKILKILIKLKIRKNKPILGFNLNLKLLYFKKKKKEEENPLYDSYKTASVGNVITAHIMVMCSGFTASRTSEL